MCVNGYRTTALCALVGQALGTLAGDTLFLMLESAGVLTLSGQSVDHQLISYTQYTVITSIPVTVASEYLVNVLSYLLCLLTSVLS